MSNTGGPFERHLAGSPGAQPTAERAHRSLNAPGRKVTHADAAGDGSPLCDWIGDGETCTREVTEITCLDCVAAMGGEVPAGTPTYPRAG